MFPQMEVGLASSFRRPDLYSMAKLRCGFFTQDAFGFLLGYLQRNRPLQIRN